MKPQRDLRFLVESFRFVETDLPRPTMREKNSLRRARFITETTVAHERESANRVPGSSFVRYGQQLEASFQSPFALWDGETGERLRAGSNHALDEELWLAEVIRTVAQAGKPQFVLETDWVLLLAIPIQHQQDACRVATAPFVVSRRCVDQVTTEVAGLLGLSIQAAIEWISQQSPWSAGQLLLTAEAVQGKLDAEAEVERMQNEVEQVSQNLASTYEEISLLYTVTQNLRISSTDEELGRTTLEWLVDCIPAKSFAIQYLPAGDEADPTYKARKRALLLSNGDCPLGSDQFTQLLDRLDHDLSAGPFVANLRVTEAATWPFPSVRQLIVVPLSEGDNVFGWLAAINHQDDEEFGTVEANLLNSVAALLGIHSGNRALYRQQSELVASVVRALVSAIDAKDPYTSGHSDRVARFAVRIALELRCNPKLVNTIYMGGLLHDVGKIGIDDNVLRKAGRLTETEFEHIKMHPGMGYKILADIKQLSDVLPAVLHHHERWDGQGYPAGLAGETIPQMARIMAVADAYDAMTSDRPYRAGMPDEKVDDIFRRGTGDYWDPAVVEAYFKAKKDIVEIRHRERDELSSTPIDEQWV